MSPSSAASKPSSASSEPADELTYPLPAGDGVVARLERAVAPYAQRFADAPAVNALRETLPVAFIAVVLYLLTQVFPLNGWENVAERLRAGIAPAFALASIVMTLALSYRLAVRLKYAEAPMVGISFVVFWIVMPPAAVRAFLFFALSRGKSGWGAFATTLGVSGLFTAIVVCLATAGALALGRRRFGPYKGDVIGGLAIYAVSGLLFVLHVSLAGALAALIAPLATLGDSFVALALITVIEAALWLVGIHGPALLAALVLPVYLSLQAANTAAHGHHAPIPHIVVVSTFLFVFPGGAGATLPLVALLLRSRVPRLKKIAWASILPSLCGINEPVIFGLPLAYNPVLAVPFVVAPLALSITTYAAMALGLAGKPVFYIPSGVPTFANVFLATLDWRAVVLLAVNLAIAGAIWLPFVRVYERTVARADAA